MVTNMVAEIPTAEASGSGNLADARFADAAQADMVLARQAMIDSQLRPSDVTDPAVVAAMASVPREHYLPPARQSMAYSDRSIDLVAGRAMNAPLATGRLLVAAGLTSVDRVLLLGAATGYTADLVARMAGSVVAVEENAELAAMAREKLPPGSPITLVEGPLVGGAPDQAPYDAVIIDGAIEQVPDAIAAQLRDGGRLVCGIVDGAVTRLALGVKTAGGLVPVPFADVGCVILDAFARPRGFVF